MTVDALRMKQPEPATLRRGARGRRFARRDELAEVAPLPATSPPRERPGSPRARNVDDTLDTAEERCTIVFDSDASDSPERAARRWQALR
jgi:hypothetical protein